MGHTTFLEHTGQDSEDLPSAQGLVLCWAGEARNPEFILRYSMINIGQKSSI